MIISYKKRSIICLLFLFYFIKKSDIIIENEIIKNANDKFLVMDLNYINSLKKLVYTINFGNYDLIRKINKEKGFDYFIFVDQYNETYNDTNWTIILIPEEVRNLNLSIIKKQRFIKTHPHLFFPNYNLSIYIDGTYQIYGNLSEFLLRILTPNLSIYILEHPERRKVNTEISLVKILKKDYVDNLMKIKERYKNENFPDNGGLVESCLIIRMHNDETCINIMKDWFFQIEHYSHRDQLSFNYILWKSKKKVKYLSKQFCFQYLGGDYIHKKRMVFENSK